jgi:hypothetical protein
MCALGCGLLIFSISLLTTACFETGAQREAARIQTESKSTSEEGKGCIDAAIAKPEYAHLLTKSHYSNSDPTNFPLQMLTDETRPTKDEIKTIYVLYGDVQACRSLVLAGLTKAHPLLVLAIAESYSKSDQLWAEFAKGKMTWGQFNTGRKSIIEESMARMMQTNMQIGSQLEGQHQAEIQQRQQAAEALSAWASQQ